MHQLALILDGRFLDNNVDSSQALQATLKAIPAQLHRGIILQASEAKSLQCTTGSLTTIPGRSLSQAFHALKAKWIAYIPLNFPPLPPLPLPQCLEHHGEIPFLAPWVPTAQLPRETAKASLYNIFAWMATASLVQASLPSLTGNTPWQLMALVAYLEENEISFRWHVIAEPTILVANRNQVMAPRASVLAIIPHFRCDRWLRRCLASLVNQSRPPDGIVVIDDGSQAPPCEIVAAVPGVTLLSSDQNVGPYRLVQQIIEDTEYDYYLFQDADDWSSFDRLAKLLDLAAQTGADLIGTQEIRVDVTSLNLTSVNYPLGVNQALLEKPGHPLLHPSSLVRRHLVMKLGGFATGLRFGGDTEFLLRAALVGRILNVSDYGYFRQKRPNSLTTAPHTGLESPARKTLLQTLKQKACANSLAMHQQRPPDLTPLTQAPRVKLRHLVGAPLVSTKPLVSTRPSTNVDSHPLA